MQDWWDGTNIHYTVYDPETWYRWDDMVDTLVVAEAAIYSDNTPKIGLYFLVTVQHLKMSGVTKEHVIERAEQAMLFKVQEWRTRVEEREGSLQVLHWWTGQEIRRRPATA